MSEPLSLEARVRSLELALTASEQWNVCVCGHHGSAHNSWNKCLVCECPHFGTRRPANTRNAAVPDAETIQGILALWAFADDRDVDGTTKDAQNRVRRYLESLPEEMQP